MCNLAALSLLFILNTVTAIQVPTAVMNTTQCVPNCDSKSQQAFKEFEQCMENDAKARGANFTKSDPYDLFIQSCREVFDAQTKGKLLEKTDTIEQFAVQVGNTFVELFDFKKFVLTVALIMGALVVTPFVAWRFFTYCIFRPIYNPQESSRGQLCCRQVESFGGNKPIITLDTLPPYLSLQENHLQQSLSRRNRNLSPISEISKDSYIYTTKAPPSLSKVRKGKPYLIPRSHFDC